MDGNNRWSKKNNINLFDSYLSGAQNLIKLTNHIFHKYDTSYVSAFALSKSNLKRSANLISTLVRVLESFLNKDPSEFIFNYQIVFIGDKSFLKSYLKKKISNLEQYNKKCKKKLFIYINYSGQDDIINSSKKIYSNKQKINKINFKNNLITNFLPNPDLLIRTGGYQRISDFMLYQLSFSELMFTKILWPNLKISNIDKYIKKYSKIERKFGI
jgi:undecaprenyl diphosphate synthase